MLLGPVLAYLLSSRLVEATDCLASVRDSRVQHSGLKYWLICGQFYTRYSHKNMNVNLPDSLSQYKMNYIHVLATKKEEHLAKLIRTDSTSRVR